MSDDLKTADLAPFMSFEEANEYLAEQAERLGVLHLSYWYLQFEGGLPDQVIWVSTYDPEYMRQYMQRFTPMGDPVIGGVMDDHVIDWVEWLKADGVSEDIENAAAKFGVTKYGISMPLPAPAQDKIIFSVCVDCTDEGWPARRNALAKPFKLFAMDFSSRIWPIISAGQRGTSVYAL